MVKRVLLVVLVVVLGCGIIAWQRVPLTGQPTPPPAGGGGGAPTGAEYIVGLLDATLTAERIVTGTSTVTWDLATAGQAKANVPNDAITYAKMQNVASNNRFLGRISGAGGDAEELTGTQATTLLDVFTSALKGLAPSSGGGTVNFLRADGTWASPSGAATTTEVDMGSLGTRKKVFTITDASVSSSSEVHAWPSGDIATGKVAGETEMDAVQCTAVPGSGQFDLIVTGLEGPIAGKVVIAYKVF